MPLLPPDTTPESINVTIGRWGVALAPSRLVTLLGSCVGVFVYGRRLKIGGLAHIVLPDSRGTLENPGKYVDTAIPAMLAEIRKKAPPGTPETAFTAKLLGGAKMFQTGASALNIGEANHQAAELLLVKLGIAIVARDLGGESGRRLTVDLTTGIVAVKLPGGNSYEI